MEVLLTKPVVVTLAIIGAVLSTAASFLQTRGYVSEKTGKAINYAGYGVMAREHRRAAPVARANTM